MSTPGVIVTVEEDTVLDESQFVLFVGKSVAISSGTHHEEDKDSRVEPSEHAHILLHRNYFN